MGKRRKKQEDPPAGLPLWMGTFADMVTLMMTFFIMLLAMANFEDTLKVQAVVGSIKMALGVDSNEDVALLSTMDENMTDSQRQQVSIQPLQVKLRQAMSKHVSDDMVRVTHKENELRLRLDDRVFFSAGSSELHPGAYALLADVGAIVADEEIAVSAEGHTDATGDEGENWKMSALRAVSVVGALRQKGPVGGDKLEAVAMGSFRPASTFGEDAAWNRRIEIVLRTDQLGASHAIQQLSTGDSNGR